MRTKKVGTATKKGLSGVDALIMYIGKLPDDLLSVFYDFKHYVEECAHLVTISVEENGKVTFID